MVNSVAERDNLEQSIRETVSSKYMEILSRDKEIVNEAISNGNANENAQKFANSSVHEDNLNRLIAKEKKHEQEMALIRANNYELEKQSSNELSKKRLDDLKSYYNERSKGDREFYTKNNQLQANLYKDLIEAEDKFHEAKKHHNDDAAAAQLAQIDELQKKLKQAQKEATDRQAYTDLLDYFDKKIEKSDKSKAQKRFELIKHFTDTLELGLNAAISRVFDNIAKLTDIYFFDRIKEGMANFSSAYEQNFTAIAGYTGSSSRRDNHDFIKGTLSTVNDNAATKAGLNFSEEVMPALVDAVKHGFQGVEAETIAITNAIDKKIMPWLDTNSETWVHFQYSLDDERLQMIKGQQLQLQETKEGNRILQSGVADTLLNKLAPSLVNIELNTTDTDDLSTEAQAIAAYLMEEGKYSKQDALKVTNQIIDAYHDPYEAIHSSDATTRLMGIKATQGGDLSDLLGEYAKAAKTFSGGPDWLAAGVAKENGVYMPTTNTDFYLDAIANSEAGVNKYINDFTIDPEAAKAKYIDKQNNLEENITATQAFDNKQENIWAEMGANMNLLAHGADVQQMILGEVINIKNWLIKDMIGGIVSNIAGDWISKGIGKLGKKLLGNAGEEITGEASESIIKSLGKKGLNNLVNSNWLTGGQGIKAAVQAGSSTLTDTAGAGLSSGGLIGGLTQGGAGLSGGTLTGGAATAAGTAGTLAAVGSIAYGGKTIYDTVKDWDESSTADKSMGLGAGAAAVGGGAMLGAASLGLASGPVGWAGLAIAAIGIGAKEVYDHFKELADASEGIKQSFEESKDNIDSELQSRKDQVIQLQEQMRSAKTTEEKLELLRKQGYEPQIDYTKDVNSQLREFTNGLVSSYEQQSEAAKRLIESMEDAVANDFNQDVDEAKEALTKSLSAESLEKEILKEDPTLSGDKLKEAVRQRQASKLKSMGYTAEQIDALHRHFSNGAASEGELHDFLNYGQVDGKNIGSFEQLIGKGQLNIAGINSNLDYAGFSGEYLVDGSELAKQLGDISDELAYLQMYKRYGRVDDKITENVPSAFSQEEYDNAKKAILSAPESAKDALIAAFNSMGDSGTEVMSDWPNSLKGYKTGIDSLARDQLAWLHQGERVIPPGQNAIFNKTISQAEKLLAASKDSIGSNAISGVQELSQRLGLNKISESNSLSTMEYNPNKHSHTLSTIGDLAKPMGLVNMVSRAFNNNETSDTTNAMKSLTSESTSIMQTGVQDIIVTIREQTSAIVSAIHSINTNNEYTRAKDLQLSDMSLDMSMGNLHAL